MQPIWPQVTSLIYKTVFGYLLCMLDHATRLENSNNEETESLCLRSLQSEEQKNNVKSVMINLRRKSYWVCPKELGVIL